MSERYERKPKLTRWHDYYEEAFRKKGEEEWRVPTLEERKATAKEEAEAKPTEPMPTFMARVECCDIPALPREIENATDLMVSPSEAKIVPKSILSSQRHVALLRDVRRESHEKQFEESKVDFAPDGTLQWTIPCGRIFNVGPLKAQDEDDARMRVRRSYRQPRCQVLDINEV